MNELGAMLADGLEALSPIAQRMTDGRRQFGVQPSSGLFWDELDLRNPSSKLAAFIRGQR
jgi:hypothetical protein